MKRRFSPRTICLLKQYYQTTSIEKKKSFRFDKLIDLTPKKILISLYSSFTKAIDVRTY